MRILSITARWEGKTVYEAAIEGFDTAFDASRLEGRGVYIAPELAQAIQADHLEEVERACQKLGIPFYLETGG